MPDDILTATQRQRLGWIRLYEHVRNACLVFRRCGISRPTLRKWFRRYRAQGVTGLLSQSPAHSWRSRPDGRLQDCARLVPLRRRRRLHPVRVLGLFPRRNAIHTIAFLERVVEEMPFPIQRADRPRSRVLRVQRSAVVETRGDQVPLGPPAFITGRQHAKRSCV